MTVFFFLCCFIICAFVLVSALLPFSDGLSLLSLPGSSCSFLLVNAITLPQ